MPRIKFRAETPSDNKRYKKNKVVYGTQIYFDDALTRNIIPESIKQLVYTDEDGKEYYEDDVIKKDGRLWKCRLAMDLQEICD